VLLKKKLNGGDSDSGVTLKKNFRHWVNGVWEEKDQQLELLKASGKIT
jgi:hypothetical protein